MKLTLPSIYFERIYVLWSPAFPFRGKVGISKNTRERRAQVEQSLQYRFGESVRVKTLLSLPVLTCARTFEGSLHAAFSRIYKQSNTMRGTSGGTEWFSVLNWLLTVIWLLVSGIFDFDTTTVFLGSLVIFFAPLPIDLVFCVALLVSAEYAIIGGVVWWILKQV